MNCLEKFVNGKKLGNAEIRNVEEFLVLRMVINDEDF
jgi:hypothetical protein